MSERYIRAQEGDPEAMLEIGEEFQRRRFHEEAKTWYQKAMDHGNIDGAFRLGDLLFHQGNKDEARSPLEWAFEKGHREATLLLGMTERDLGNMDRAEKLLRLAMDLGFGQAVHELGVLYLIKEDYERGIYWIEISADSGNLHSMEVLPQVLLTRGEQNRAEKVLKKYIERGHAQSAITLGLLLDERGDESAVDFLKQGITLGHPMGEVILANHYFVHERYNLSEKYFRDGLSKSRSIEGTLGLGVLLCELDRTEEGIDLLKEAAEYGSVDALYNLGVTYYNLGDHLTAEEWLLKAMDKGDKDAESFYNQKLKKIAQN